MKQLKKIVIIGGGTAGWATALNFLQKTIGTEITVVSTKEIPIIGVGESTTGRMNDLINYKNGPIKIDEIDFMKKTNSTYKIGIYHQDWHTIGKGFTSPLGDEFENQSGVPEPTYDYYRIWHVANKKPFYQTQSKFMMNDKMPMMFVEKDDPYLPLFNNITGKVDLRFNHVAYHLDATEVSAYLKTKCTEHPRVRHIEGKMVSAAQDEQGMVTSITTDSCEVIEGDLFVDCSGQFRALITKYFDNKFISWEDNLLNNRALSIPRKYKEGEKIHNYTTVRARKYGWEWNIPLQHRIGAGYVFDDRMISPEEAHRELEESYGCDVEVVADIKFTPGRLEKIWVKNVLSTGLCSGFLEPLEATSIHMTILQMNYFLEQYYTPNMDLSLEWQQDNYNNVIGRLWDDLRDFITLHYITPRNDTPYWIEASDPKRWSPRLTNLMNVWKTRMPRLVDYISESTSSFHLGNTLWYQILIGMDILDPELARRELESFNLTKIAQEHYEIREKFSDHLMTISYDTDDFYKNHLDELYEFYRVRLTN